MRTALLTAFIVLAFGGVISAQPHHPSLAEVLQLDGIPSTKIDTVNLLQTITSYSTLNDPDRYVIAYYKYRTAGVEPPLIVRVFNKHTKSWSITNINNSDTVVLPDLKADCLGSVLDIKSIAGDLALETHLTPSAGCTIILTPKLDLKRVLYGWIAANTYSLALLQHSEIHFAPTHPVELSVYDFATDKLQQIYPPAHSAIREEYKKVLQANLSMDWCQQNNSHCDPQLFGADLGEVAANDQAQAFAFDIKFRSEGYGPQAESVAGVQNVIYVFWRQDNTWDFREFPQDAFPTKLEDAVKPEILRQLFAGKAR